MMKIGFIGFGEAAFNISLGLYSEGMRGICAYDTMQDDAIRGRLIRSRAKQSHVQLKDTPQDVAKWADILFSAVPSSYTLNVCEEIKGCLRKGKMYVDVSASTPAVKEMIWKAVRNTGVYFVDAAMLGSLPQKKHQVPMTVSGNGAELFRDIMTPYHMDITLAGANPGAAAAIKLVRSVFMKGVASLMIEMLEGAQCYGVADDVIASLSKSWDGTSFESHLNRLVTGTGIHCKRRADELKGSIQMLKDAGLDPIMTTGAKSSHEALETYDFASKFIDKMPTQWQQIVDPLLVEKNPV